jgi:LmbE family N-acetylglucosaminyl deacetylase
MTGNEEGAPKRALAVAAHPDDTEFGCAGTAAMLSQQGWEVYYLICTNGNKGSDDPEMTPEKLAPIRKEEQRAAAKVVGVKDVFFLDYEDGELAYSRELLGKVVWHIRKLRPNTVFTHDPESIIIRDSFINHSDHRVAGLVTIDAVYPAARDRWNFPEHIDQGLQTHKVGELCIWSFDKANHSVDITDTLELKLQALSQHKSQFGENPDLIRYVRERWKNEEGRHVEQFRRIVMLR